MKRYLTLNFVIGLLTILASAHLVYTKLVFSPKAHLDRVQSAAILELFRMSHAPEAERTELNAIIDRLVDATHTGGGVCTRYHRFRESKLYRDTARARLISQELLDAGLGMRSR